MALSIWQVIAPFTITLALGNEGCASAAPVADPDTAPTSIAVYALSRGKGVPEATRSAFAEIKAQLETDQQGGTVVQLSQRRIGIEGEIRLCARFADKQAAQRAFERFESYAAAFDLLNVVLESCIDAK